MPRTLSRLVEDLKTLDLLSNDKFPPIGHKPDPVDGWVDGGREEEGEKVGEGERERERERERKRAKRTAGQVVAPLERGNNFPPVR